MTPRRILSWLRDEKNRTVIGWLGGGVSAVAIAAWAVFTFFVEHRDGGNKPSPSVVVEQKGAGFASGRDTNVNAPVTINPDASKVVAPIDERIEKLTAQQNHLAAQIAREKGVSFATLQAVLVKMGEKGVKEEDIPKLLDAKADELVKLRQEIEAFRKGAPDLAAIAEQAQKLIDKGDLDEAHSMLAKAREAARAQRQDASRDEAGLLALDARVDDL